MVPNSIDVYADLVLEIGASYPSISALIAKGIYLYETENYVAARDYLNRGIEWNFYKELFFLEFNKKKIFFYSEYSIN